MQKTARLAGRLISQELPRTLWGGAPPQEVLGPSSEGPRPLLGHWNLLIYLPIWQFFECMTMSNNYNIPTYLTERLLNDSYLTLVNGHTNMESLDDFCFTLKVRSRNF